MGAASMGSGTARTWRTTSTVYRSTVHHPEAALLTLVVIQLLILPAHVLSLRSRALTSPFNYLTANDSTNSSRMLKSSLVSDATSSRSPLSGTPLWEPPYQSTEAGAKPKCPLWQYQAIAKTKAPGFPQSYTYRLCSIVDSAKSTPLRVRLTNKRLGTTWDGWGTSLSTMGRFIGSLNNVTRRCITELMFDKRKGLGLNIVRYNIPSGYHPAYTPKLRDEIGTGAGFWPVPWHPEKFDPGADMPQRLVLRDAKFFGVDLFEAIAYSPPWWMTISRSVEGIDISRWGKTNLKPMFKDLFAVYIAQVVRFLERAEGITFNGISPFNEPLEGWWNTNTSDQSWAVGCNYQVPDIIDFLPRLRRALGPTKPIAGFDSWFETTVKSFRASQKQRFPARVARLLSRFDVHSYVDKRTRSQAAELKSKREMRALAKKFNKPIWQTEWGPLGVATGRGIDIALYTGRKIIQDINIMGVSAWFFWGAAMPTGNAWGAFRFPLKIPVKEFKVSFTFYVTLHFTRFVPPGSMPLKVPEACVHTLLAVYSNARRQVAVTVVNQHSARTLRITLGGFSCTAAQCVPGTCQVQVFRTSSNERFQPLGKLKWLDMINVKVKGFSVTTFVFMNVLETRMLKYWNLTTCNE